MFIDKIERYKGSTMCVTLSNGSKTAPMYLHSSIVTRNSLKQGMELTAADVRRIKAENEHRKARERALYLIEDQERSRKMIYDKLLQSYPEEICQSVCDELCSRGIIDDRRYAERYCASALKKYGRYRVKQELWRKGIAQEIIDELFENDDEDGQTETAYRYLKSHLRPDNDHFKEKNRLTAALSRRGFSYDTISKAFARLSDECDDD